MLKQQKFTAQINISKQNNANANMPMTLQPVFLGYPIQLNVP